MKLNFSISELIKSDTAIVNNINNMPDIQSLDNLLNLIYYCLQPLRDKLNKPIIITSGYRCFELNRKLHGAANSQHLKGQAADFIVQSLPIEDVVKLIIKSDIPFDQLINEYGKWVHISFDLNNNRRQILKFT